MAEASDDEDDAPMPVAPPEPEVIDMPPAPVSARPMSNLERCVALRLVYGAGPTLSLKKNTTIIIPHYLSVVSRVRCPVCPTPGTQTVTDLFSFAMASKSGDFCAVLYTMLGGGS